MLDYNEKRKLQDYVFRYYKYLMTATEVAVIEYIWIEQLSKNMDNYKVNRVVEDFNNKHDIASIKKYLEGGVERFKEKTLERLLKVGASEIKINRCPKCNKIARTNKAKQCRYCGHSWH